MQFKELNVIPAILKALEQENYEVPTPIQEEAIPIILSGRDLLGCAQTGTGKTAAFAIPTLQRLCSEKQAPTAERKIRALIVTPTRELALQIYESFRTYGRYTDLRYCVIFGGVSQKPQEEILQRGVDILIATPGRLNDLIGQKRIDLKYIKIFILDEADRMLDMGFINDIKRLIAKIPVDKQTLLFSATMPPDIAALSGNILKNPARVEVTPISSTVDTIEQYLYYVDKINKKDLLCHILRDKSIESALVFTRTKHGADRIVRQLSKESVVAQAIHGDKSQGARQNALTNFKSKKLRILIATDIAARGIDIDELSHVINYDLPNVPETYVHRIGRTGRAGLGGVAISFCDFDEKEQLADIEGLIGKRLEVIEDHPYPLMNDFPAEKSTQPRKAAARSVGSQHNVSEKEPIKSAARPKKAASENTHRSRSDNTSWSTSENVYKSRSENTSRNKSENTSRNKSEIVFGSRTENTPRSRAENVSRKKSENATRSRSENAYQSRSEHASKNKTEKTTWSRSENAPQSRSKHASRSKSENSSSQTNSKQTDAPKKKYRMTSDGVLKEKKSYFRFPKRNKK